MSAQSMNPDGKTDAELLELTAAGDKTAFRIIFRRHEAPAYGLALNIVRSSADAEEVVGSAFMELWRKRNSVRFVNGSVRPWLMVSVSHICRNHIRGRSRHGRLLARLPPPEHFPDHADEIARVLDDQNHADDVRAAIAELREAEAAIVILCVLEEVPMEEAARILGIPLGTAKSRLSRAKSRLKDRLDHLRLRTGGST
ncbi:RNA polymerase sigma factor [Microbacterium chocolatum]|uniref:RNA polymerase sigma factor n=1 Tax=Microbacterium aurantiacum TaxID=162393 RepID=UPI00338E1D62